MAHVESDLETRVWRTLVRVDAHVDVVSRWPRPTSLYRESSECLASDSP